MKTLAEIIQRRDIIAAQRLEAERAHMAFLKANDKELRELQFAESLIAAGVDLERIARGALVVHAHGSLRERSGRGSDAGDRRAKVVADAKTAIAAGGGALQHEYLGVKNYDSFGDQRCDCQYGFGPTHGSIVFSIGLTRAAREQLEEGRALSPEQIEDALYLLANLASIEKANGVAA